MKSINLSFRVEVPGVDWGSHGLFPHLTLVHVPGGLVEVGQGNGAGQVGEEVCRTDLLVGG